MRGPIRSVLLAALALVAFAALTVGQASAATMKNETSKLALLAIYGNPGTNGATVPVGGGLGRNFGFGENMLFEASTEKKIGKSLEITLLEKVAKAEDSYIGGTLMSNTTGENNPLSFGIQFVDFQDSTVGGVLTQSYADTWDRHWISEICPTAAVKCRVDPLFEDERSVKIEDVSFDLGGIVVQGTVWGKWADGKAKEPPCIVLENKPAKAAADQTLIDTQGGVVGAAISNIAGTACLISANNDWYTVGAKSEPAITIENK